jgi:putative ABC transport system permease protein
MLLHYIKVGIRNLLKYKVFSFINVFGLAAAMSVGMLILLMLADQKSHDQFNVNKDRIYRVLCDKPDFRNPYATSAVPLAAAMKAELPGVEVATHLVMGVGGDILVGVRAGGGVGAAAPAADGAGAARIAEVRGYFADTSFFRVFSYELAQGDRVTALAAPRSVVITHELAARLFGDADPVGRTVEWEDRGLTVFGNGGASTPVAWGTFTVTGVIAERHYRSHLKFDVLMSESSMAMLVQDKKIPDYKQNWEWYSNCFTYALMRPGRNVQDLDAGLREVVANHYRGLADFKGFKLYGQPLTRISPGILLGNDPVVALPMVAYYFLSSLAVLILVLAALNYVNLSVARALNRAKEIGVRKVTGAQRINLVLQFLGESVITALAALTLAVVFLFLLKAAFVRLWVNQYLNFELNGGVGVYLIFVGFAVVVGVLAGLYPALRLSGIGVIPALKNNDGLRPGRMGMRKVLSVVQFVFSLLFIVTSILIYNQFRYFIGFKYEFNTKNVVNIDLQNNDYRVAEKAMTAIPGVAGVSACEYMPAETRSEGGALRRPDGKPHSDKSDFKPVMTMGADEHFLDNLGLKLLAGRGLLPEGPEADRQIVVNEALVKAFGYSDPSAILGQRFESEYFDSGVVVIGVVQDFHMRMILGNDKIEPLYLYSNATNYQYVNLKLATGDIRGTVARLGEVWKQIDPVHGLKYSFFSDELANQSQGIFDVVSILGSIAVLAVMIACLGMLGMATFTTERRRKEVGIRKVLGAGNLRNVLLLSREFLVVLGVSIAIAAPLSYILNEMWLRVFPNRVEFGLGTVLLGTMVMLVLGLVTIGSQTVRASRRNPVDALKVE